MRGDLLACCGGSAVLCDGAMGTQLIARGMSPGECGMAWNENRPDDVAAVHAAYVAAGCRLITTNSFGGSRSMLERHGNGDRVAEWNRLAAGLARRAAGEENWVLGDVGPCGDFLEPMGELTEQKLGAIFAEQIAALAEGGADAILVETMSDPAEAAIGIRAAKSTCGLPVIATFAFQKAGGDFRTMMGTTAVDAVQGALDAGADVVGANCGTDLSLADYESLTAALIGAAGGAPVILQPNAGAPKTAADGSFYYDASPAEMAAFATRLKQMGVRIVGGCCGTTPTHLGAMAGALQ